MTHLVHLYPNGIRLLYLENQGEISHCGLMIGSGSRDEQKGKEGLAHFIEHVLFKGTKKRSAYQVLNQLDIVGGELNAYTAKEETCVHASMLNAHFEKAVELISDIVFHSQFPVKEIEKEKEVVLDEINSYQENPAEQIYDDFDCMVFRGQPLGNPVLGTPESVKSFTRNDILKFTKKNYTNERIIFAYTGNLSFEKVKKLVGKYLANEGNSSSTPPGNRFKALKAKHVISERPASHSHYILGNVAYSGHNKKRFPLFLLNNILGGPGMNSRLNMKIREKYGYTYHIESAYMPFRDTGLFNVYFATETKFLEKCIALVNKEFDKLRNDKISDSLLTKYKYQLKGQIAIAQENRSGVLLNSAKSVLSYNYPLNISEVFRKIDTITSTEILEVANEILDDSKMSSLHYKPE
jgi:predicted Zn-dependent peptidase